MYSFSWELRGLSPNFHIHVTIRDLSIPRIGKHISCRRIGRSIVGIYKSLTDTWMWKLGLWPRNPFSGKICFEFSALFFAVQLYSPCPVPKIYLAALDDSLLNWIRIPERGIQEVLLEKIYAAFRGNRREGGRGAIHANYWLIWVSEWLGSTLPPQCIWCGYLELTSSSKIVHTSRLFFASSTNLQSQSKAFRKNCQRKARKMALLSYAIYMKYSSFIGMGPNTRSVPIFSFFPKCSEASFLREI